MSADQKAVNPTSQCILCKKKKWGVPNTIVESRIHLARRVASISVLPMLKSPTK